MRPEEFKLEAQAILSFWSTQALNTTGYVPGKRNGKGEWDALAPLGLVLHARILWTFATAARRSPESAEWHWAALRAYQFLESHFAISHLPVGYHWSLAANLTPLESKQQVYGLAFVLYALSAYYKINPDPRILQKSQSLFFTLEEKGWDSAKEGYWEVFPSLDHHDIRLSTKDEVAEKTMNTHLHVLEGYTELYQVWPDSRLKKKIEKLLNLFFCRFWQPDRKHLGLFFDADWNLVSPRISFGHEVEAAWLIPYCARVIQSTDWSERLSTWLPDLASAALEGWDGQGLRHEYDPSTQHLTLHREWWVSAESVVGFWEAYRQTGDPLFLHKAEHAWHFIQSRLKNEKHGEWYWGIGADDQPMVEEDSVGFWKCPYHSVRACFLMEDHLSSL
ncbi:MAG: AGE family epimerase/isomerase [Spirosomataceae bacterium]